MGVRSTPGCSPSSFSSIVEAGRLFSCQPPSPSVPPSSPSPLLPPSLPPSPSSLLLLGLLAPWVHGGSHQWLPAAGPRRWSKPTICPFFPHFDCATQIFLFTSCFGDKPQCVNLFLIVFRSWSGQWFPPFSCQTLVCPFFPITCPLLYWYYIGIGIILVFCKFSPSNVYYAQT